MDQASECHEILTGIFWRLVLVKKHTELLLATLSMCKSRDLLIHVLRCGASENKKTFRVWSVGCVNQFLNKVPILPLKSTSIHIFLFGFPPSATIPYTFAPALSESTIAWTANFASVFPGVGSLDAKTAIGWEY